MPTRHAQIPRLTDVQDATYCSRLCQKAHWDSHRKFCQKNQLDRIRNVVKNFDESFMLEKQNGCIYFAVWFQNQNPSLRLVAGSLGIGMGDEPFFEYGGPHYTKIEHFVSDMFGEKYRKIDAHIWGEDSEGNIFDVVTASMIFVAQFHKKKIFCDVPTKVNGKSKEACRSLGLHYLEASKECSPKLLALALELGVHYLSNILLK